MNTSTADFIKAHRDDDIRRLALKAAGNADIDLPFALDQIAGRQAARRKLPSWAATEGIVYPPHLSMEQCSSEPAALYKAAVAARLTGGGTLVDITGGFGVDFSFMARRFHRAVYVERQSRLCDIAGHNLRLLGLTQAEVVNADGIGYLRQMDGRVSMIFADPARRDDKGGRTFAISDCTPDVAAAMDMMLAVADRVMLKLSPMLDWRKAVQDIGPAVAEVHIVSVAGECKELLIVASRPPEGETGVEADPRNRTIKAMAVDLAATTNVERNGGDIFSFDVSADTLQVIDNDTTTTTQVPPPGGLRGATLYEPGPSIMKAGCFGLIERRYGVRQIERNSHLFVGDSMIGDFPGRRFIINNVSTLNKKELRTALAGITKANIATRNFPMTVAGLRKRLRLADGGDTYIFATTLADKSRVLLVCSKAT